MPEALSQVVVHSFIAALFVEALVRSWDVPSAQRLSCRVGALALPVVVWPLFELLAPFRHAAWFADGPALFASRHLAVFSINPLWPLGALGVLLLVRDLLPFLRRAASFPAAVHPVPAALLAKLGPNPPQVTLFETQVPLLLCVGARTPRLLISTGVLELFDEGELEAALAHELSHVRHRDVAWNWVFLALRVLQPFSPAAQVVGRVAARELEWRADADAVRLTRRPLALASALLKVHGAPTPGLSEVALSGRAKELEVETRCRRLLEPHAETPVEPALFAFAALGLATLLFFVT